MRESFKFGVLRKLHQFCYWLNSFNTNEEQFADFEKRFKHSSGLQDSELAEEISKIIKFVNEETK